MTTKPGHLVIAAAIYLLAGAAVCSKQGGQAGVPFAALATTFVVVYFVTRRAALVFVAAGHITETSFGSFSQARAVIKAVERTMPHVVALESVKRRDYSLAGMTVGSSTPSGVTPAP